jgi:acetyl-CoA C-acetyltransferase
MSKVYIYGAKRTAIGGFLGTLKNEHPSDLGATVIKTLLEETNLEGSAVDEVIVGNILPAGLGQGVARQTSIKAGLPIEVPAYSLNMVCGSGMKSVMNAYSGIKAGISSCVIAGGVESMSRAPFITSHKARTGNKLGTIKSEDHIIHDALTDAFNEYHMGITAENIADKYSITREMQDEFALTSQTRAISAIKSQRFKEEIVAYEVKNRKGTVTFDTDEHPNHSSDLEKLAKLRPAFKKEGTVTAGNASGINDGASFVIIGDDTINAEPLAEIISIGQGGVDPSIMGMGPVPAIESALKKAGLSLKDIDLLELNEAFAAQSLGVIKELSVQHDIEMDTLLEKTNVNGGAIALGHPVGVSGNRIIVTLIHEMIKQDKEYGLASLCIGGGMGTAIIIKR